MPAGKEQCASIESNNRDVASAQSRSKAPLLDPTHKRVNHARRSRTSKPRKEAKRRLKATGCEPHEQSSQ
eukprot:4545887-Pleurochrysis_carterae.AAC.2